MPQLAPGDLVDGRYRVHALIARGGMAAIYRGIDERLDRPIALKVLDDRFAEDPTFRQRFVREARAAAKLSHPTLVNVYDQGDDGRSIFLAMELVDGGTLRELLRERGPMPPYAAVAVMIPVLTALGTAHSAGLIHRDIKPENILISDQAQIKLADFGLVRAMSESHITATSVMMGTVAYLSPEQVRGTDVTAASDVYSAGIVLYELLTGQVPFRADSPMGTALARLDSDVPPASATYDSIPPEFDELIWVATNARLEDRFTDGHDFLHHLVATARHCGLPLTATIPAPEDSASHRSRTAAEQYLASTQVVLAGPDAATTVMPQTAAAGAGGDGDLLGGADVVGDSGGVVGDGAGAVAAAATPVVGGLPGIAGSDRPVQQHTPREVVPPREPDVYPPNPRDGGVRSAPPREPAAREHWTRGVGDYNEANTPPAPTYNAYERPAVTNHSGWGQAVWVIVSLGLITAAVIIGWIIGGMLLG